MVIVLLIFHYSVQIDGYVTDFRGKNKSVYLILATTHFSSSVSAVWQD